MPATLLRPYYLSFRNRFHPSQPRGEETKRDVLLLAVAALVMGCVFTCTVLLVRYFQSPFTQQLVTLKIVELLAYVLFLLLLASNTVAYMGNLYTSNNMNLFLAAPLSSHRLFVGKVVETTIETSMMCLVFLLPVSAAFLYLFDLPLSFFAKSLLVFIPFLLIPSCTAVVFATMFAKFAAALWRRGNLLIGTLLVFTGWGLMRLLGALEEVRTSMSGYRAIIESIGLFENPNPSWMPSRWVADVVVHLILGNGELVGYKIMLLWGTTGALFALAFLTFDFFLLPVRSAMGVHERNENERAAPSARHDLARFLLDRFYARLPLDSQTKAIIIKDLTNLARDRAQALLLLTYIGISLVYLVLVRFFSAAIVFKPSTLQVWWAFLASVNVLFTGFILTCVMTRLVYPSISLEGRSFWILLSGPIELRRVLLAKFFCWLPLSVVLGLSLIGAGALAVTPSPSVIGVSLFAGLCMSIGCTGLAIGIGAWFASFEWESPNQITVGFGTLVLLLSSLVLVVVTTVPATVMTFLAAIPGVRMRVGPTLWPWLMGACGLLAVLLNYYIAQYACRRGSKTLAHRLQ